MIKRYSGLKRKPKPLNVKQQVAATQKQFIRGVLLLMGITLLIIFIFEMLHFLLLIIVLNYFMLIDFSLMFFFEMWLFY